MGRGSMGVAGFRCPLRLVKSNGNTYYASELLQLELLPVTARTKSVATGKSPAFFFDTNAINQSARIYTTEFTPGYADPDLQAPRCSETTPFPDRALALIISIGGIVLASGSGFVIARAALRPVRQLSETAEDVRMTRDLTKRIAVSGNDELSHLAMTFNAMLESLDEAANQQRQLVQDASHELRTPLTSLRTNIEMLASKHRIPAEERAHMLSDVVAQLTEMTALIGELTELARGEELHPVLEEVRLDLIAEDAIRRTTRNQSRRPDRCRAGADNRRRYAGDPRAGRREPARQRGQVEPRRLTDRRAPREE